MDRAIPQWIFQSVGILFMACVSIFLVCVTISVCQSVLLAHRRGK